MPQFVQRTPEWYVARQHRLTASDIAAALDIPPFESFNGSARTELLMKKKHPDRNKFMGNEYTEWGQKHEPEAIALYEKKTGAKVLEFGLMIHPEVPWLGASPDGITADGVCIEVKAPLSRQIVPGTIPKHYYPQVQCQLQVLGLEVAHFVQYRPSELTWPNEAVLDVTVVPRDDDWWRDALPKLEKFRKDVEAQDVPEAAVGLKVPRARASKSKEPVCLIVEDNLEDMLWHAGGIEC